MNVDPRPVRLIMELRRAGVRDVAALSAIERVPRELFVPESLGDRAYDNVALPIGEGQTISQPLVVAAMTEALELDKSLTVLEVGTGSGYQAAVLARLCRRVYTIERHRLLFERARARFLKLRLHNVTTRLGDGWRGWPEAAPFPRIIVTAAAPEPPPALLEQLKDGGIMVLPVGEPYGPQELVRLRRNGEGYDASTLMPVRFVPLVAEDGKAGAGAP